MAGISTAFTRQFRDGMTISTMYESEFEGVNDPCRITVNFLRVLTRTQPAGGVPGENAHPAAPGEVRHR